MVTNRIHAIRPHLAVWDDAVQLGGRCAGLVLLVAQSSGRLGHFDFTSEFLCLVGYRWSLLNHSSGSVCSSSAEAVGGAIPENVGHGLHRYKCGRGVQTSWLYPVFTHS